MKTSFLNNSTFLALCLAVAALLIPSVCLGRL